MGSSTGVHVEPAVASKSKRRQHSIAEKRRLVEETLVPGVSVARVARAHGVNANQVFSWRRLYKRGLLGSQACSGALLPVTLSDPQLGMALASQPAVVSPGPSSVPSGSIQLQLPKGRLRIEGAADPAALRVILECLLG